jgi:3',5'-cyclic AMP phosphodiesterase CpdA
MKIVLAADLHFGSVPEGLADNLRGAIENCSPDVIVIAGDLTLRARDAEFAQARSWLRTLATPALVLPGNHDLPYWNLFQRFANPFHRYKRGSGAVSLMPVFEQPNGIVLGFNTTGSWQPHLRWQEGVARSRDIDAAKMALCSVPNDRFKAVAAHHPLLKVAEVPRAEPARRGGRALRAFASCGADMIMSGHTHRSFAIEAEIEGHPMVAIGAPTALSTRMRGESNGFWFIEAQTRAIVCTLWLRAENSFRPGIEKVFKRRPVRGSVRTG